MEQTLFFVLLFVALIGFMFWSQWRARRRYQQQLDQLQIGDQVMTIGGIYGKLTRMDRESHSAHLEVAPGVEIRISLSAISRRLGPGGE
ncbi:MAG: preprotein translocase subunit YajC [Thermoflexia bacterium]|nr:MAG: preprotein translocase subunit YajC [Thermoflexia bacterium]